MIDKEPPKLHITQIMDDQSTQATPQGQGPRSQGLTPISQGHPRVQIRFEDVPLWEEFDRVANEMIVSKPGRMMFPVVRARISGLDPNALYVVLLEFKQVGDGRWKYANGEWKEGESKQ